MAKVVTGNVDEVVPDVKTEAECSVTENGETKIYKSGMTFEQNGKSCRCSLGAVMCDDAGPEDEFFLSGTEIAIVATAVSVTFLLLIFIAIFCYKKRKAIETTKFNSTAGDRVRHKSIDKGSEYMTTGRAYAGENELPAPNAVGSTLP